jgi:hypothetical protein
MSKTGLMTRTALVDVENLTPEEALPDEQFAESPWSLRVDWDAPLDPTPPPVRREPGRAPTPVVYESPPEPGFLEARERLMRAGVDSEVLGSMVPRVRIFRRRATLVPACAAATAVALFVLQLYVAQGALG